MRMELQAVGLVSELHEHPVMRTILVCLALAGVACSDSESGGLDGGAARDAAAADSSVRSDAASTDHDDAVQPGRDSGTVLPAWTTQIDRGLQAMIFQTTDANNEMRSQIDGVVASAGEGIPAEGQYVVQLGWKGNETRWMKIQSDANTWTIVATNLPAFAVQVGSDVHGSFYEMPGFNSAQVNLELRVEDELAFYYEVGLASYFRPDDVAIARGKAECATRDSCATWTQYMEEMSIAGGAHVALGTGQSTMKGGYVFHNIIDVSPESTGDCSDIEGHAALVIARTSPLSTVHDDLDGGDNQDAGL
jgi:hypothetical protein